MITASTALDQNRATFAIPSAVTDKRKSGTNLLIKEGKAALVESVDDIIAELHPQLKRLLADQKVAQPKAAPELNLFEQKLYDVLEDDPIHTADALVHLLSMEFKGAVKQLRGKMFVKS
jgi:DNA processing protein